LEKSNKVKIGWFVLFEGFTNESGGISTNETSYREILRRNGIFSASAVDSE
jgi:hypothetical protein